MMSPYTAMPFPTQYVWQWSCIIYSNHSAKETEKHSQLANVTPSSRDMRES